MRNNNRKFVLMGLGNELRGDDGVGPFIARKLARPKWLSLDCGTAPENFVSKVKSARPHLLVIVDAAFMNLSPGEFRKLSQSHTDRMFVSTHSIPFSLLLSYMDDFVDEFLFLGVQPKEIVNKGGLSPVIYRTALEIVELLASKRFSRFLPLEDHRIGDS